MTFRFTILQEYEMQKQFLPGYPLQTMGKATIRLAFGVYKRVVGVRQTLQNHCSSIPTDGFRRE